MFEQAASPNILIQMMPPDDFALVRPYFKRVSLEHNRVLSVANEPIEHIYFPEDGIVSITGTCFEDRKTEVGIVGREGLTGIAVLLGVDQTPHDTFVQVEGKSALRIEVEALRKAIDQSASLHSLLLRYVQTFIVQSGHSTITNAHYHLEARLARWLLMCHDRIDGDEIRLTHQFMSMMIAAQRTGVTVCLHNLEAAGMIRSQRSRVVILNRSALTDLAGGAYGTPEAEYRRLIRPFGRLPSKTERSAHKVLTQTAS